MPVLVACECRQAESRSNSTVGSELQFAVVGIGQRTNMLSLADSAAA